MSKDYVLIIEDSTCLEHTYRCFVGIAATVITATQDVCMYT